jgi:hypothetical protein
MAALVLPNEDDDDVEIILLFGCVYFIVTIIILLIASRICAYTGRGQIGYYRWLLYPWLALHLLFLFNNLGDSALNHWFSVVVSGQATSLYLALNSILVISSVLPPYPARSSRPFSFWILLDLCLLPFACLGLVLFGGALAHLYNQVFLEINPWRAENPAYTVQSQGTYLTSRDGKFMQFIGKGICSFSKSSNRQSYLAVCAPPYNSSSFQVIQTVNGKRIQEQMIKGSGASLSPDGQTIAAAISSQQIVFLSSTNPSQVFFSFSVKGNFLSMRSLYLWSMRRPYISWSPTYISWSPNSQLAILETDYEVYIIDLSTRQRPVITYKPMYRFVQWSPDSRQVLLRRNSYNPLELYLVSADGKTQRQLARSFEINVSSEPIGSPDGRYIAMTVAGKLTLYNVATGSLERFDIVSHPWRTEFIWSPDSQKLALLDPILSEAGLALSVLDLQQPEQVQSIYQAKKGMDVLGINWLDNDTIAFSRWIHPKHQLFGIPIRTQGLFVVQVSSLKTLPIAQYVTTDDAGFMPLKDNTFSFFVGPFHILRDSQ